MQSPWRYLLLLLAFPMSSCDRLSFAVRNDASYEQRVRLTYTNGSECKGGDWVTLQPRKAIASRCPVSDLSSVDVQSGWRTIRYERASLAARTTRSAREGTWISI
jgi:hypothetical protein